MEYIKKLAELYASNDVFDMLIEINQIGVIAGGSVVYALNDFVPSEKVGDIDIFIQTKDDYIQIMGIIHSYFRDVEYGLISIKPNFIMNIGLPNEKISLQLIWWNYKRPMQIIENFDYDYVQCALHKNELLITDCCREAHETQTISVVSLKSLERPFSGNRLQKAINKGFKCRWLIDYVKDEYVSDDDDDDPDYHFNKLLHSAYPVILTNRADTVDLRNIELIGYSKRMNVFYIGNPFDWNFKDDLQHIHLPRGSRRYRQNVDGPYYQILDYLATYKRQISVAVTILDFDEKYIHTDVDSIIFLNVLSDEKQEILKKGKTTLVLNVNRSRVKVIKETEYGYNAQRTKIIKQTLFLGVVDINPELIGLSIAKNLVIDV